MTAPNDISDDLSSPACAMHEADDAYMGYAAREELIAFLNELLEAERAGARVTLESASVLETGSLADFYKTIHKDEARWCAMLIGYLEGLGSTPSPKTGTFYEKALAIRNTRERLVFLNRGQGWVVRKLHEWLPRVRDERLHADLTSMLRSHEANIALANKAVGHST